MNVFLPTVILRRLAGAASIAGCCLPVMACISSADTNPLDALELPAVEKKPWRFTGFPIIAWWAPPGDATQEDFIGYREAGFNLHPVNPDTGFWDAVEKAEQAGLKLLPFRNPQGFALDAMEVDFAKVKDRDSVVGWITHDEPGGYGPVIAAIEAVNALMREDPARWTFFNFLPPQAQQNPSTEPIIEAAVRHGMPILSYDHYIMHGDGTSNRQQHFDNLDLFRNASLRFEVPFWAFALTIQHWHYRQPSESDIRWKQFTNLAYGAKGLWYFTYWGPTDWENWDSRAIVDSVDGSKTNRYEHVKAINWAVRDVGEILLTLTSEDVRHTRPPPGHRRFEPGTHWISGVEADDVTIGFFLDPAGVRYAWVVNNRHGMNQTATESRQTIGLEFAPGVSGVTAVSWLDGQTGPIEMSDTRSAALEVAGGTGVLLRATERSLRTNDIR